MYNNDFYALSIAQLNAQRVSAVPNPNARPTVCHTRVLCGKVLIPYVIFSQSASLIILVLPPA